MGFKVPRRDRLIHVALALRKISLNCTTTAGADAGAELVLLYESP